MYVVPVHSNPQMQQVLATFATGPSTPPPFDELRDASQMQQARTWLEAFRSHTIQRNEVDAISFSRSSGPGGQNVNKVNSKATVRCHISRRWIPSWAKSGLQKSPYYASSTTSLLITSDTHRSQSQNIEECLKKLHDVIYRSAAEHIKNEPSEAQKERVRDLQRAEKARMRSVKEKKSQVKQSRKKDWD